MKNIKRIFIVTLALTAMLALTSCGSNPRTEISLSGVQAINGKQYVDIDYFVYDFGDVPSIGKSKDNTEVVKWLVNYTHCYDSENDGEEIENVAYYMNGSEFKKGKQCKITVQYYIPEGCDLDKLVFEFDLDGFEADYKIQ